MPRSRRAGGPGRRKADAPHPVDVYVGARVRQRRIELGMSQERLAAELGLTFQQVQKYERAANRISASRLHRMGITLGVDAPFFFAGYREPGAPAGLAEPPAAAFDSDPLRRRDAIELLDAFHTIEDPDLRGRLTELARGLAAGAKPK
jgi:transcriptional regulator with XRE-family HTH domain